MKISERIFKMDLRASTAFLISRHCPEISDRRRFSILAKSVFFSFSQSCHANRFMLDSKYRKLLRFSRKNSKSAYLFLPYLMPSIVSMMSFLKIHASLRSSGNFGVKSFNIILQTDQQVYGITNKRRSHRCNSAKACKERMKDPMAVTHWLRNLGKEIQGIPI